MKMGWFHAVFLLREEILKYLVKPSSLSLSHEQIVRVVDFARMHYERIGSFVVHKLMKKVGLSTLVSNAVKQVQISFHMF